jgi:uncharacterized protein YciI
MPVYALQYRYTDDVAARDEYRPDHRAYLGALAEHGMVLASGPFVDHQPDGALLVVQADSREVVDEIVAADPFRVQGVVADYTVTEWTPVIGRWAADLG